MGDFIEATHRENEWRRAQVDVKNAKQGVRLQYWPYAGSPREGSTARLGVAWATLATYDKHTPVVIPEACLLLTLDEMRALRDQAIEVVKAMEDERERNDDESAQG